MFKEAEKGDKEVYMERTEEALGTGGVVIATACPFCMTMLTDGLKDQNLEEKIQQLDVAELLEKSCRVDVVVAPLPKIEEPAAVVEATA